MNVTLLPPLLTFIQSCSKCRVKRSINIIGDRAGLKLLHKNERKFSKHFCSGKKRAQIFDQIEFYIDYYWR